MKTFIRSAQFEMRDDGRTLTGCIVPYGQIAEIVEYDDERAALVRYAETFLPHSLAAMAQSFRARGGKMPGTGQYVPLLLDHNDSFDSRIGYATELTDEEDGAYATFRLYDANDITKVRSILNESHNGLSVAFKDIKEPKINGGVISRVQVFLGHVAATPTPAYSGAMITGMRSGDSVPEMVRPNLSSVREWLANERKPAASE